MTFVIGFVGSAHCAGMCGGIVLSCAPDIKHNSMYQVGRLLGYIFIALLAGVIGQALSISTASKELTIASGIMIGGGLIYLGFKGLFQKGFKIKMPKKIESIIYRVWGKALPKKDNEKNYKTAFTVGALSILLPCGLLYSVVLTLGALNSPAWAILSVTTFWLGTLPAMSFAPTLIKKVLRPLSLKLPLVTSVFLIMLGVSTVIYRVNLALNLENKTAEELNCHD